MTTYPSKPSGHFVLVLAGSLRLLFPLDEMVHITHMNQSEFIFDNGQRLLGDEKATQSLFMSIDHEGQLAQEIPEEKRFLLTQIAGLDVYWSWSEVNILTDQKLQLHLIPDHLLEPHAPSNHIVEINGQPTFLCNAEQFLKHVFENSSFAGEGHD